MKRIWEPDAKLLEQSKRSFAARLARQWRAGKMDPAHREAVEYIEAVAACGSYSRYLDWPKNPAITSILGKYGFLE